MAMEVRVTKAETVMITKATVMQILVKMNARLALHVIRFAMVMG